MIQSLCNRNSSKNCYLLGTVLLALQLFRQTTGGILEPGGYWIKVSHHSWNYVVINVYGMETAFVSNSVGEVWCPGQWNDWLPEHDAQEILLQ